MNFKSSPAAVKYFESLTKAWMVEQEATYLSQCCHLNLPMIYGMNNTQQPYFIVTQFYGSDSFKAVTLHSIVNEDTTLKNLVLSTRCTLSHSCVMVSITYTVRKFFTLT